MKNKKDKLKEIFDSDEFNLLNIESSEKVEVKEEDQRLIDSFQEISNFFERHERPPGKGQIMEFKLYSRLESIKKDPSKWKFPKVEFGTGKWSDCIYECAVPIQ